MHSGSGCSSELQLVIWAYVWAFWREMIWQSVFCICVWYFADFDFFFSRSPMPAPRNFSAQLQSKVQTWCLCFYCAEVMLVWWCGCTSIYWVITLVCIVPVQWCVSYLWFVQSNASITWHHIHPAPSTTQLFSNTQAENKTSHSAL